MLSTDEARVWALVVESAGARGGRMTVLDVCVVCARLLDAGGVGLSVLAGERPEPVHTVGALGRDLMDSAVTSGDGPCAEALLTGAPVLAADLADPSAGRRWPIFTEVALAVNVAAVFAFPLVTGAMRAGVLVVGRDRPGALDPAARRDALILADAALTLLLDEQAGRAAEAVPAEWLGLGGAIHQAAGMVSIQLDCTVDQALVRLRAHAFANDMPLTLVARQVVERTLRFAPDPTSRP
ncbi:GAF and ANTAR domain-containing protein [Spirillospora sp. CA-294931]|uniref:GAF and ANTAR domain-containing protein n=1 Tax=Spirillospora sp. CA-294931 TaxID=3240042 RepID=UPI003D905B75